jgi:hypothetical protein
MTHPKYDHPPNKKGWFRKILGSSTHPWIAQVSSALRVTLAPGGSIGFREITLARADWARYFRDAAGLVPG